MDLKIDKKDRLSFIAQKGAYRYYKFTPRLMRLYPVSGHTHTMNLKQKMRFLLMRRYGYKIYLLADTNDNILCAATYQNGGSYRYPFARKTDLIYGPIYTQPQYRGKGLAVILTKAVIEQFENNYENIYATIHSSNISSIQQAEKSGFIKQGRLKANQRSKKFELRDDGDHILVSFSRT